MLFSIVTKKFIYFNSEDTVLSILHVLKDFGNLCRSTWCINTFSIGGMSMFLTQVSIKNFRSIEDIKLNLTNKMMCIVGRNDVGKSTVIKAIETFFGKRNFMYSDFPINSDDNIEAQICMTFTINKPSQEFIDYMNNDTITIKHTYTKKLPNPTKQIHCLVDFIPPSEEELQSYAKLKTLGNAIGIEFPKKKPQNNDEIEELRTKVLFKIEELKGTKYWTDFSKQWSDFQTILPEVISIPAAQDPDNEQKLTNDYSVFGSLFRVGMKKMLKIDSESQKALNLLEEKMKEVNQEMISLVEGKLKSQGNFITLDQKFDTLDVSKGYSFQMEVIDEDGIKTPLAQRGNGLQRSVLIAIIRAQAELNRLIEEKKRLNEKEKSDYQTNEYSSYLYLIEEPEAFLHLSAQRELYYGIKGLLTDDSQAIITTHSTMFMDESDFSQIISLYRDEGKTFADQARDFDEIKDHLGELTKVSELMTGKVCCLVEGKSDELVFKSWATTLNKDFKELGVYFINMSGCSNAEYYANAKIMKDFRVPFFVILDKDAHSPDNAETIKNTLINECKVREDQIFILNGELENYFPLSIIEETFNLEKNSIDAYEFKEDPKKAINNAFTNSNIQRKYRETRDSIKIAKKMSVDDIHSDIKEIINQISSATEMKESKRFTTV